MSARSHWNERRSILDGRVEEWETWRIGGANCMDVEAEIQKLIRNFRPDLPADFRFDPALPLAEDGLGLDSIGIFELLVACDEHFGIRLPESLFEQRIDLGMLKRAIVLECARVAPGG